MRGGELAIVPGERWPVVPSLRHRYGGRECQSNETGEDQPPPHRSDRGKGPTLKYPTGALHIGRITCTLSVDREVKMEIPVHPT
jgi:hypothetical protein